MKKAILIFTIFFILILPINSIFAETKTDSSTGFISGDIWYSKIKPTEGDDIKIYTAFWNGENSTISIKVSFFDKDTILGEREVTVPALTIKDVSIPWKVTSGDHKISARVIKATSDANGKKEDVFLATKEVQVESIFIPKKINADIGVSKLGEIGEKVVDVLPEEVSSPITESVVEVDLFRQATISHIETNLKDTKIKIEELENPDKKEVSISKDDTKNKENSTAVKKDTKPTDSLSSTEKPIAYVQLFFLTIALFIFSHSFLFYGLIVFFVFIIIRFIFRKIRGK